MERGSALDEAEAEVNEVNGDSTLTIDDVLRAAARAAAGGIRDRGVDDLIEPCRSTDSGVVHDYLFTP